MTPRQQGGYAVSPTVTSMRLLALYLVTRAVLPTPPSVSATGSMDRLAPTPPESAPSVTPPSPSPGASPETLRGTRRGQLGPAVDDDPAHQLLARYLHSLPDAVGPAYCPPSLAFLARGRIVLAGTRAGYLQWHPLDQILTSPSTPTPPARIHAHHGPVTCLAAVPVADGASLVVATGGHDTTVRLWAVSDTDSGSFTLTALHTFRHGIAPVVRIVPGPDPGSIVTVAADHAVAVLDVASRALVLHLPGPAAPPGACAPSHVAWRDEYVLVVYAAAGLIYVWDRVAGALERVLRTAQVGDLGEWAAACDKWLDLASAGASGEFGNVPAAAVPAAKLPAVSLRSLESSHVLVVNLKRVVAEGARDMPLARALVNVLLQRGVVPELDALIAGDVSATTGSNGDIVAVVVKEGVTLGVRGASGNLSLMTPRQQGGYAVSPTVTSMRLLALYLVTRAVLPTPPSVSATGSMDRLAPTPPESAPSVTPPSPSPGASPETLRGTRRGQLGPAVDDDPAHQLLARYLHSLPDAVGPAYCPPSLAFLARYWRDSLPALQQGARRLLVWSVQNMPRDRQAAVVHYWHSQLPVVSAGTGLTKTHARATVISAVLACDVPHVVSLAMAKDVALSLVLWMGEDEGRSDTSRVGRVVVDAVRQEITADARPSYDRGLVVSTASSRNRVPGPAVTTLFLPDHGWLRWSRGGVYTLSAHDGCAITLDSDRKCIEFSEYDPAAAMHGAGGVSGGAVRTIAYALDRRTIPPHVRERMMVLRHAIELFKLLNARAKEVGEGEDGRRVG
ncbi:hypothetical protein AMAG_18162 [Allomyces macrogynus ATCC 38327]|uniref:Uncharacterized protein n=1 Tax=Allomyces macrogynus (strain ATCC 38327) TaxID=578462 RepID=A0A0L0SAE9_ALLM3|nr:hypothetical protein AMAG_18162 [Allomyces macrogynus ATCC 38327]|eukprot:KNE59375.1 hypothetical protein AMAG_18162 [Allomyces macrogynus ATCC 38327]